jgi:hypothetical protein
MPASQFQYSALIHTCYFISDPFVLEEVRMTNEEALYRLAKNSYDSDALESFYANNRTVIDAAIRKWFGHNAVVPQATRYVLGRVAARTTAFAATPQTSQPIAAGLADEEARDLYDEIEKRIADWRH